jgi:hypothetical protein
MQMKANINSRSGCPDASETLKSNPLYSVHFANENIFDEATGYNSLGIIEGKQKYKRKLSTWRRI